MYKITKEFSFEYAHMLNLDYDSPCNNIHGHSAVIKISLYSETLNKDGMVIDFKNLKDIQTHINDYYDHRLLIPFEKAKHINCINKNVVVLKKNPTAENIATMIGKFVIEFVIINNYKHIEKIKIEMFETDHNSATLIITKGDRIWMDMHNVLCNSSTIFAQCKQSCNCSNSKESNPFKKSNDLDENNSDEVDAETEEDDDDIPQDIHLVLTPIGLNYLTKLNNSKSKLSSVYHTSILKLLTFCDEEYITIPQNKDINSIISNINYQYYDYMNSDSFSFDAGLLMDCIANGYLSFAIIDWD